MQGRRLGGWKRTARAAGSPAQPAQPLPVLSVAALPRLVLRGREGATARDWQLPAEPAEA